MNKRLKKKKLRQENRRLILRFPFLIPRNVWTDKIPDGYDYSYTCMDSFPAGWRKAFGMQFLEELRAELMEWNYLGQYRVVQVKEKYGQLRWYDNGAPAGSDIDNIIDKYSIISENVCMSCGELDVPMTKWGWIYPSCRKCYHGSEPYEEIMDMGNTKIRESYSVSYMSGGTTEKKTYDINETVEKIRASSNTRHHGKHGQG